MIFRPLKYKQPIFGDSRCALYALANMLDSEDFLTLTKENVKTDHNYENKIICEVSATNCCDDLLGPSHGIHPYFIVPDSQRIYYYEFLDELCPDMPGHYSILLFDIKGANGKDAHTIGVLWPDGDTCIVIDPQKDSPVEMEKSKLFARVHVWGIRIVTTTDITIENPDHVPFFVPECYMPHLIQPQVKSAGILQFQNLD